MCIYYYNSINYNTTTVDDETYFILKQIFESINNDNLNNAQSLTKKLINQETKKGNTNIGFLEEALNNLM
ncbi:hypothetical protein LZ906_008230 [Paraclostridium ghonii]|uniref:hypothetical protein n=1 Tax=Paraclostridium ghonii TaxID=29358 RepID=UPI0035234EED